jgi:hypothetical protein
MYTSMNGRLQKLNRLLTAQVARLQQTVDDAAAGRCHTPICHVIELDKMRLFIYIPICMDQIWTFNLVYIYADWSFCYLTYNVFSFYGLSYILYL